MINLEKKVDTKNLGKIWGLKWKDLSNKYKKNIKKLKHTTSPILIGLSLLGCSIGCNTESENTIEMLALKEYVGRRYGYLDYSVKGLKRENGKTTYEKIMVNFGENESAARLIEPGDIIKVKVPNSQASQAVYFVCGKNLKCVKVPKDTILIKNYKEEGILKKTLIKEGDHYQRMK